MQCTERTAIKMRPMKRYRSMVRASIDTDPPDRSANREELLFGELRILEVGHLFRLTREYRAKHQDCRAKHQSAPNKLGTT